MSEPVNEDGLIPSAIGAAMNLAGRATRGSGHALRKTYDRTNFAAQRRGKRATVRWVHRINRDWQEYIASQGIDEPMQSDLWRFFRDEYGPFDPKLRELFDRRYQEAVSPDADEEWEDFKKAFQGGTPTADRAREQAAKEPAKAPQKAQAPQAQAKPAVAASAQPSAPDQPQAAQQAPAKPKVHNRPRQQPAQEPGLADQPMVVPRHRSDVVNFDDYEDAEKRNAQIRAARADRARRQKKESVAVDARALLETAGSLIAYANAKRIGTENTLETIDAMAESFEGNPLAFSLARRVVAERIADPAQLREAALSLLSEDARVSKDEIKKAFVTVARALLSNPDVRYATIRLDPTNARFDSFYSSLAGKHGGSHYGRGPDPLVGLHTHDRFGHAKGAFPNKGDETAQSPKPAAAAPSNVLKSPALYDVLRKMEVADRDFDDLVLMIQKEGWAEAVDRTEKMDPHEAKCMLIGLISALSNTGQ